ncbi:MAG: sulfatase-like hydrolase/transferase, partial [Gloeobacteraceae cyanobacterium ES-bin-144]|nr:sulfatase-like hydrolase/transferase [Verrucomicrobiales bacterium]
FGKWHLGDHEKFLPLNQGFDEFFGIPYSNDMWPLHPTTKEFPPLPLISGNEWLRDVSEADQRMMTKTLTEKSIDFINRNREQPFFLLLTHTQPHVPLYVSESFNGKTKAGLYADVIAELDWSVGEILNTIQAKGLDRNTLIIFTSDNGPWLAYGTHAGSAKPFREGKRTAWEGGTRVPCIMRWPDKIPAGTTCATPAMHIDILPTLASLIGASLPDRVIDGKNIWPLLSGENGAASPHLSYWFYNDKNEFHAIVSGKWKLILPHTYQAVPTDKRGDHGMPVPSISKTTGLALYDLQNDPSESTDISASQPEKLAEMMQYAEAARSELGDSLTQRTGKGTRKPGSLTDSELADLKKKHWPKGEP